MCCCWEILKMSREASGCDALWSYDPGPASNPFVVSRWARHAQGPAPSMNSMICLSDDLSIGRVLGAVFDSTGFMSSVFNLPTGYLAKARTIAAWNGSSIVWIYESYNSTLFTFNLSGTLIGTAGLFSPIVSPMAMSVDPNGNLVWLNDSLERRNASGSILNSLLTRSPSSLCVDSANNTIIDYNSTVEKYNSSFSLQWSTAISGSVYGLAATSGNSIYAAYADGSTGNRKLSLLNSSGAIQWTVTLPFTSSNGTFADLWCDGTNAYLAYVKNSQAWRTKYDSSGSQQFEEVLCWNQVVSDVRTIRANGSVFTVAGRRP